MAHVRYHHASQTQRTSSALDAGARKMHPHSTSFDLIAITHFFLQINNKVFIQKADLNEKIVMPRDII